MKKRILISILVFVLTTIIIPCNVRATTVEGDSADGLWSYIEYDIPGYSEGYMIIGYHGEESDVTLPTSIDGYPINSVCLLRDDTIVNLTIPRCYTAFGTGAFSYCKRLKTVTFSREYEENEIKYFGSIMFAESKNLRKVVLPNLLPKELQYTRASDTEYEAVILPDGTFQNCKKLTTVIMPENLTEIDNCAFENCTSLNQLTIPEGVQYLNDGILDGCTSLREISLPSTIEGITSNGVIPPKAVIIIDENNEYIEKYIEEQAETQTPALIIENPEKNIEGDIDGNGTMDICDVTFIQACLAGKIQYNLTEKADLDGNGKINICDATYIQMKLAHLV